MNKFILGIVILGLGSFFISIGIKHQLYGCLGNGVFQAGMGIYFMVSSDL